MKPISLCTSASVLSTALILSACGGADDGPPPDFELGLLVNGQPVAGVDVLPGDDTPVYVSVGKAFELDSSGPVTWTVIVGGSTVVGSGNTILYGGATIEEVLTTTAQFAVQTSAAAPLATGVPITIYATSLNDGSQVARVDVLLTN